MRPAKTRWCAVPSRCGRRGLPSRVAVLPEGHDPDSFVKAMGAEKLKNLVTNAPSFFVYLLDRLSQQHDPKSERGKQQIIDQIAQWLLRLPNPLLFKIHAQEATKRLGIVDAVVEQTVLRLRRRLPHLEAAEELRQESEDVLPSEKLLLQAMLADERVLDVVVAKLDAAWLSSSVAAVAIRRAVELRRAHRWNGPTSLLSERAGDEIARFVSGLLLQSQNEKNSGLVAGDCLTRLEERWVRNRLGELRQKLSQPNLSKAEMECFSNRFLTCGAN